MPGDVKSLARILPCGCRGTSTCASPQRPIRFIDRPMSKDFAELDFRSTPLGDLSLRRRRVRSLDDLEVFEVKLGDAFLMSSLFHEVEVALADRGLAALAPGSWDVVVGGLGLGYTAVAALKHPAVRELIIVDALE